jgi:5-methylcytosine-specific restriction endonuclease McrA
MAIIQLSFFDGKVCRRCHTEKPTSSFSQSAQNRDGLQSYCRECGKQIAAERRHNNPDVHNAYVRAYNKRHPPHVNKEQRRRWRESNRMHLKAYYSAYQKKNRHAYAEHTRVRFHRQRGNGGSYTHEEWIVLCEQFAYQCACCGAKAKLTVDHIVPVIKGGTSDISNLQPLCHLCNSKKGSQIIDYRTD